MSDPIDRVGSEAYLSTLRERVAACEFPDPEPRAVPALTEARHVARAAEDAGDEGYAAAVRGLLDPVFEPLEGFESAVAALRSDDRENDPAALRERLDRRTRTFFDYPAPPHDFAEAAEATGRELLDVEVGAAGADHERERRRVRAVVVGGRATTDEWVAEVGFADGTPGDPAPGGREFAAEYGSPAAYADTVAFNVGLAVERWLATEGEVPRAP